MSRRVARRLVALSIGVGVGVAPSAVLAFPGSGGGGGDGGQVDGTISAYVWTTTSGGGGGGGGGCSWELITGTLALGQNGSGSWPRVSDGVTYNLWRRTCGSEIDWYEVPVTDPADLLDLALDDLAEARLPRPTPTFYAVDPANGWAFVRVPLDFRVDPSIWQPVSVTAGLGPYWATATASPAELSFISGDPAAAVASAACTGEAATATYDPAAPGACSYTFANASSTSPFDGYHFQTTTSIDWAVSWRSSTGAGGQLPGYTTTSSDLLAVAEVQGVVTCTGARPEEGGC